MRTIIAGSRTVDQMDILRAAIAGADLMGVTPTVVLSGTAGGVDQMGEQWARENGIRLECYPANWTKYGKSAGYRRNEEMAKNAEALIAIWHDESKGTGHMIEFARRRGLRVVVWTV